MRLIDADLLKENILKWLKPSKPDETEMIEVTDALVSTMMEIDEQPTAFDVDKVVEQIEHRRANFDCKLCKYNDDEKTICSEDCSDALIDDLIKIVKEGGLNERNSFQGKAD